MDLRGLNVYRVYRSREPLSRPVFFPAWSSVMHIAVHRAHLGY